jgi:murein tripeptide amidase MpaA
MKKHFFVFVPFLFAYAAFGAAQDVDNTLLRIEQATTYQLDVLVENGIDIDNVRGLNSAEAWQPRNMSEIDFWANQAEQEKLKALGLQFKSIRNEAFEAWQAEQNLPRFDRNYHDYIALTSTLQNYASNFPSLTNLYSAGQSEQGRELWVLEMGDNPGIDEDEPEFKYISTMHGDEPVGTELMIELIDDFLTSYGSDSRLTGLMNDVEMHFMPMMNPDGNAAGQRNNINGINLNRNFPDPYVDPTNTPAGRAAETGVVMNWSATQNFDLSANFHTGALVVNYPFDNNASGSSTYTACPDDAMMIEMSEDYSSTNLPMWNGSFNHGITNGADWYAISGGMQDWVYCYEGGMELTVELNNVKWPNASELPGLWDDNRESMIRLIEWSLRGIRGVVTDSNTGLPLEDVEVRIQGRDHATWSATTIGDYHRIAPAGTFALSFEKEGYESSNISGVFVSSGNATHLDVALVPLAPEPNLEIASVTVLDGSDGILDPGEFATLQLQISNDGTDYAHNILSELSGGTPYVSILTGALPLPDLAPGASAAVSFDVSVDAGAPFGSTVQFACDLTADAYATTENFSLTIHPIGESFESGDFTAYPWQQGGNANWVIDGDAPDGAYSAQSGNIGDNQTSSLALTQDCGEGDITFFRKVSSESTYDFLRFYIDGGLVASWSGELPWQEMSYPVTQGEHLFAWEFTKDGSVSTGSDCGWIDDVQFPAAVPPTYPHAELSESSVVINAEPGASGSAAIQLSNTGEADLEWTAATQIVEVRRASIESKTTSIDAPLPVYPKGEMDEREGWFQRGSGGPDTYGYSWVDSDDASGPDYLWTDIVGGGTTPGSDDDAVYGPINLGFSFDFYGQTSSAIYISTNGFLSFSDVGSVYQNQEIPASATPNGLIAPFWDDMNPSDSGTIYYLEDAVNDRFIVQFEGVVHYGGASPETFQVILNADGSILFQYETVSDASSTTVGIESPDGSDGLGVSYNSAGALHNGLAIRFATEEPEVIWLSVDPNAGTVIPGASTGLTLTGDASELAAGTYLGEMLLNSNDPDSPQIVVSVQFEVGVLTLPAVTDLSVFVAAGQVTLLWTAIPGAEWYRVEKAQEAFGVYSPIGTVASPFYSGEALDIKAFYRVVAGH